MLFASFAYAGAQSVRTRHRPDPWRTPEWVAVVSGFAALVALIVASNMGLDGLRPAFSPLTMPTIPLLPTIGILISASPAFLTPALPTQR
jgi:energy-coupling factor transport system permease protein